MFAPVALGDGFTALIPTEGGGGGGGRTLPVVVNVKSPETPVRPVVESSDLTR
jgi:hypothetical protein